jgi:uncharacterized protein (TIGR03382 family)
VKRPLLILAIVCAPQLARAFPTGLQFDADPMNAAGNGDGAGGIAFTGSPRFAGHTCAVCHIDAPGRIGIRVESDHPELFTDGWKPRQQYHLRVILTGEWAAAQFKAAGDQCGFMVDPYSPCDENGFAFELDDASGQPAGTLAPSYNNACVTGTPPNDADARVLADGSAITHTGAHMGQTTWDLCWTAPAAGASTLTAYVAVVDGNGGDGTMDWPNDAFGDDVAAGAVPLVEMGATGPTTDAGGCDASGGGSLLLAAIALVVLGSRRRWRAIVAALLLTSACVHVRPHQRETLAARKMKFAPDPTEDELDLHMQESREGSSGGYGSAGGGCGCN